jgi:thioredoxin-disulfide reductase
MPNIYDLIIIGGGPAGITAGIYGARKKINTLLLTKDFVGQVGKTGKIENWPGSYLISGQELIENFRNHLRKFEIEIKEEEVKKIGEKGDIFEVLTLKNNNFQAKTVIVASGRNPRPLKVPGEEKFMGKGVSFCSLCDAPFFKDKVVAVVGGGNSGFEAALDLEKYCPKVYILEFSPQVKVDEISQERAEKTGKISVITQAVVEEIKGRDFVESIVYEDKTSGQKKELEVQGVFVEIGSLPATAFLGNLVDFNQQGEIKIDLQTCATKTSGLFAAGDVTDIPYKQIIIAAGEGAKAALSAYQYLQK